MCVPRNIAKTAYNKHRKFKLYLGFGQKYLYEGNWLSDEDGHLALPKRASLYGRKWSF